MAGFDTNSVPASLREAKPAKYLRLAGTLASVTCMAMEPLRFRAQLKKAAQTEPLEDRLIEAALLAGGYTHVRRSVRVPPKRGKAVPKEPGVPPRIIRGLALELAPGLEQVELFISPEGMLLPTDLVTQAEKHPLKKLPWIVMRTHFARPHAHAAMVDLLEALRGKFFETLEFEDPSGYAANRDLAALARLRGADPAAEQAAYARLSRILRDAAARAPEHPLVHFDEDDDELSADAYEAKWDLSYLENERRNIRIMRSMDERMLFEDDPGKAFKSAMRDEGLGVGGNLDELEDDSEIVDLEPDEDDEAGEDEAEKEFGTDGDDSDNDEENSNQHPLLQSAEDVAQYLMRLPEPANAGADTFIGQVLHGSFEATGGLVQALSALGSENGETPEEDDEDDDPAMSLGLALVQLKRARRGAAFALAALPAARADGHLDDSGSAMVTDKLRQLVQGIETEIGKARSRLRSFQK